MSIKKFTPPTNRNWGNLGFIKSLVLMVVMIVTTSGSYAFTINSLSYKLNYDGNSGYNSVTLIVSENGKYSGTINIPQTVTYDSKTYNVTAIGEQCIKECNLLAEVRIPSTATSIGNSCFGKCSSLNSIVIPSSVTSLGSLCFSDCTNLEAVFFKGKIPSNLYMSNIPTTCTLYVLKGYLEDYKKETGYRYSKIREWDGCGITLQCERPTAFYAVGETMIVAKVCNQSIKVVVK